MDIPIRINRNVFNITYFLIPVGISQFTNLLGSIPHIKLCVTYLMANNCVQHMIMVDELLDIGY